MYRIGKEEIDEITKVIESKQLFKINNGLKETENAEIELKEKFGCNHAILMTSGHAALTSALVALGIGPGDQVIVPAYTYIATAMVVVGVGAIPVLAEVNEVAYVRFASVFREFKTLKDFEDILREQRDKHGRVTTFQGDPRESLSGGKKSRQDPSRS